MTQFVDVSFTVTPDPQGRVFLKHTLSGRTVFVAPEPADTLEDRALDELFPEFVPEIPKKVRRIKEVD